MEELRKFPRREVCAQQRVVAAISGHPPVSNVVLSRNLSASGFCYKSPRPVGKGETLLIHLDDSALEDLQVNKAKVMKVGKYVLSRVIWSKPIPDRSDPYYEIGCSFVSLEEGGSHLDLFTSLLNHDTAQRLGVNQ
ncbi:MAG: hypothetical protein Q7T11_07340 [Deltaproteobacteria bacterium]|nr:hypothetical protein [Deltaproteobacteria bacterium]